MNRHAYLIIAHNEPELLMILLRALDVEWNDIYLHIDRRNPFLLAKARETKLQKAKLMVVEHPMAVYWGHFSQVEVELLLLRMAVTDGVHAYYHLLSGCDLPIKSQTEIRDFFHRHQGREFVSFWNSERDLREARKRTRYFYILNRYGKRSSVWVHAIAAPLRNVSLAVQKALGVDRGRTRFWEMRKGSQWFSITEDCARYVLDHEFVIRRAFRFTLCPDEIFLHTLIWNSPFRECLFDVEDAWRGSMRAIDWQRGNPYVWQKKDTDYLLGSPYLFARKFSSGAFLFLS